MTVNSELNKTKEDSIQLRERKASSGATIEGLKKRRNDLLERVETEIMATVAIQFFHIPK